MRTILRALSLLAGLLGATAASAGILTTATWLQVTQGVPMTRTTAQLGATGFSRSPTSISVNLTYPSFSLGFFVPKTSHGVLDLHIQITQGGTQAITATPAMGNGSPGVPGTVIVMTANHVAMGMNASMYVVGINTLVQIPVSVGHAGQFVGSFTVLGLDHTITVDFFAWTPGMVTFSALSTASDALPTVMATGSFMLNTASAVGTVTLVAPTKVSIDGVFAHRRTASFTTLKLTFVPEPSTLLLLGAAAAALLLTRRGSR